MSYIYQKVYKYKRYPHFDNKVHWRTVKGNVETPEYIIHHAFFPFIHYEQKMTKFPKKFIEKKPEGSKRDDPKTRQIMYSSHIDRYIYEYSRAVTPQIRQAGNRLSGLAETAYASLLA